MADRDSKAFEQRGRTALATPAPFIAYLQPVDILVKHRTTCALPHRDAVYERVQSIASRETAPALSIRAQQLRASGAY